MKFRGVLIKLSTASIVQASRTNVALYFFSETQNYYTTCFDYVDNVCKFSIYHSILSYHNFLAAILTLEPCFHLSLPSLLLEALPSRIPLALHHEEVQEDDAVRTELGPPHISRLFKDQISSQNIICTLLKHIIKKYIKGTITTKWHQ